MLLLNTFEHDTRVEKEAATLAEAGYAVTVLALAGRGLPTDERRGGVRVRRIARPSGPRLLRFVRLQSALGDAVRELRPSVIHCHDSETLLAGARAARSLQVPFVYDAHDLWLGRLRRNRSWGYWQAYRTYYATIERRYLPRAAGAITVSPPIARHLERRYHLRRVDLVPNYPEIRRPPQPRELRDLPGLGVIPPGAPVVLYLGGVMSGRGVEQLIEAMRGVEGAHLVLLGGGPQRDLVARVAGAAGVADRVHAADPVPSDRVIDYASTATIGVSPILPSCLNYRYSLPNKLFQYMAAGLPVVASNFEQVREVVEGSGAGTTVDPADPLAMGRALAAILADPRQAAEMGQRARAAVEQRYNWGASAQVLLEVYGRVLPLA